MKHSFNDDPSAAKAGTPSTESLRRCVGLLVQGIIIHSPRLEAVSKADFSHDMTRHLAKSQQVQTTEELLPVLSSIMDSFASYGKRMERYAENVERELSSMLILLCEELLQRGLPPVIEECLGKLGEEISDAKNLQDFVQTRKNLQKAFQWSIAPEKELLNSQTPLPVNFDSWESPTGFPGPTKAKDYLARFKPEDISIYVVMFKLTSLHAVEQRYGGEAAQDYLNSTAQYMVQTLRREDRLFHWSRDILMAVVDRRVPDTAVRTEISRLVVANREQVIEVNGRKVMIANPITFDTRNLSRYESVVDLLTAFDPFVNGTV